MPQEERWARVEAEVERLTAAGGRRVEVFAEPDGKKDHVVMADPEGNEFCAL